MAYIQHRAERKMLIMGKMSRVRTAVNIGSAAVARRAENE
jgi:hypothetical protein